MGFTYKSPKVPPSLAVTDYSETQHQLWEWQFDEWCDGNRVKASKLARIRIKYRLLRDKYQQEMEDKYEWW